jgi:hypothetical protein
MKKLRVVITSNKAKEHLVKARTLMEEIKQDMLLQQQKNTERKQQNQLKADEQKRFDETNHSKLALEQLKKTLK